MNLFQENSILDEDEFIINVNSFMNLHTWSIISNKKHKIYDLKHALINLAESCICEMKIIINPEYPYSLDNELYLYELLEEHRNLNLIIIEMPTKVVPRRLIISIPDSHKKILNLTNIYENDIEYIKYWILPSELNWWDIPNYINYWTWEHILISWDNPLFCRILHEITNILWSMSAWISSRMSSEIPINYNIISINLDDTQYINGNKLKELRYFYMKLENIKMYKNIALNVSPGLLGNTTNDYMKLTKKNMERIDLLLSSYIWDNA